MNRLSVAKAAVLLSFFCFPGVLLAAENLFIFVFKNGVPQPEIRVQAGDVEQLTNEFGVASFSLPAEEYEIGYYQGEELFALTEVNLLKSLQSQVFLNLRSKGADVVLDLPLAAYDQEFEYEEVKEQTGPKGTLRLAVRDSQDDSPVANVKLYFRGYAVEASSNEQGIAEVELSEGEYDISLVHPRYVMQVMRDVSVKADALHEEATALIQSDIVLDEYVVTAPFVEGSLASTISEVRDSDVLAEAISSEQFSKSGDSSASGALKRVTAITIVDGKFVFVRGLGERYSSVLLNGLNIPSPEPTKRVVPLDIFPTGVIQSMSIQKTYSSELPGTFGGGTVLINTKDIPEEDNYISGSISVDYSDSTGDTVQVSNDNDRPLPDLILDFSEDFGVLTREIKLGDLVLAEGLTEEEKRELNLAMVRYRDYGLEDKKLEPGGSLSLSLGQSFKTSGGLRYGFAGSAFYKTKEGSSAVEQDEYQFSESSDNVVHLEDNSFDVTKITEEYGGLISFAIDNQEGQKLKYTYLDITDKEDLTNFGVENELVEDRFSERTFLQYVERNLTAHQFNGEHYLGESQGEYFDDIKVSWGIESADATRLEPGTFEYEYKEESIGYVIDAKKLFYLYSDLEDSVDNKRLDIELPFDFNNRTNYTRIGWFEYDKARNLDNRRFKIKYDNTLDLSPVDEALSEENVENDTLDVLDSYKPDDFYTARQDIFAFYFNQLISPYEFLDLNFGFRAEKSTQTLKVGTEEDTTELLTDDKLPFLGITYRLDDEQQIRFGYSETISRPDFREFSPNRYKDPLTGNIIYGFDELRPTEITNWDLKYEWYPSFDEFLSFGVFVKDFTDPIETVRTINDVDIEISFRNAQSAQSLGVEAGFRKNLESYFPALKNYFVSSNFAWIDSEITLDKEAPENENDQFIPFLTTESRPMQGQSPYVFNLKFGYDNFFTRRSAIFLYNVYGERISSLGINGNPDIYEQPFHRLDFVLKWGLNDTYDEQEKRIGYTLTFKVKNILDSEITEEQGGRTTSRIQPGREFNLSFSMKY